jgi:hypothetical protein
MSLLVPIDPLLNKMNPIFSERGVSATLKIYQGTTRAGNATTDTYRPDIVLTVLTGKRTKWSTDVSTGAKAQVAIETAIFRSTDLPDDVVSKDVLKKNNKLVLNEQTYDVREARFADPFYHMVIEGA